MNTPDNRDVLSVSELNRQARGLLERSFSLVWVEGEISNLARPSSGHYYFSLKDAGASVRCALFKLKARLLDFTPANGIRVVLRGRVSLYEERGEFQLIAEHLAEAGAGALQRQFEELKRRLLAEGLFAPERKQSLPKLPRRIGVVTSPSGAAVRDVLSVLRRRCPSIPVLVYPVPVQGAESPAAIVRALQQANRRGDCDVLLLTRGGGSLEDLWAFNTEAVARAVYASAIPVVSAVGHEVDFSISDFVADVRAPTPSAAAELLSPDAAAWRARLDGLESRLHGLLRRYLEQRRRHLQQLGARLQHPRQRLQTLHQRLDGLELRLLQAQRNNAQARTQRLRALELRLHHQDPRRLSQALALRRDSLDHRLRRALLTLLNQRRGNLSELSHALHLVSPLATLERGYAIVSDADSGAVLLQAGAAAPGQRIRARLAEGGLLCEVLATEAITSPP